MVLWEPGGEISLGFPTLCFSDAEELSQDLVDVVIYDCRSSTRYQMRSISIAVDDSPVHEYSIRAIVQARDLPDMAEGVRLRRQSS